MTMVLQLLSMSLVGSMASNHSRSSSPTETSSIRNLGRGGRQLTNRVSPVALLPVTGHIKERLSSMTGPESADMDPTNMDSNRQMVNLNSIVFLFLKLGRLSCY